MVIRPGSGDEEDRFLEVLLALDGVTNVVDCGDCLRGVSLSEDSTPSNRIFRNISSPHVCVRPCKGHVKSYVACTWFQEV